MSIGSLSMGSSPRWGSATWLHDYYEVGRQTMTPSAAFFHAIAHHAQGSTSSHPQGAWKSATSGRVSLSRRVSVCWTAFSTGRRSARLPAPRRWRAAFFRIPHYYCSTRGTLPVAVPSISYSFVAQMIRPQGRAGAYPRAAKERRQPGQSSPAISSDHRYPNSSGRRLVHHLQPAEKGPGRSARNGPRRSGQVLVRGIGYEIPRPGGGRRRRCVFGGSV